MLKTLEEHNLKTFTTTNPNEPILNGIACPECGEELLDSYPMIILTSLPARKNIHCPKCNYKGYRNA